MPRKQAGFTLVEIAIVLVIIGLLLGGVLKGQELITQAKIKNIANDFNATTAAILAYQDRYRRLPGDDAGATRWAGVTAGNSDGSITGTYLGGTTQETGYFWQHLRSSGFITGSATDATPPLNAVGGILGVEAGAGTTGGGTGVRGLSGVSLCSSKLPGKVAIALDTQYDDGASNAGGMRGFAVTGDVTVDGVDAAASYVEDSTTTYVVCRSVL
ncbi:MAG: prepilin-type N-terminal cleavage/methylation domain-containing protein [Rhodocyclaceae bacterium]|nr:prepilin-type N-terminal cleavage/methylation domain-containing protein [Rhodocyclaceae bacterium]